MPDPTHVQINATDEPSSNVTMEKRLTRLETQFETVIPTLATKTDMAELRHDISKDMEEIRIDMQKRDASMSRWMLSTTLVIVGTVVLGFTGLFFNLTRAAPVMAQSQPQAAPPVFIYVPAPMQQPG